MYYVSTYMRHKNTQKRFLFQLSKSQLPTNCCVVSDLLREYLLGASRQAVLAQKHCEDKEK